ncbi:MAG TPA: hypothetical protein VFB20_01955 [Burkholderiales bacterium]|nr:hypothetical protein [Burkholderiales bacterium]
MSLRTPALVCIVSLVASAQPARGASTAPGARPPSVADAHILLTLLQTLLSEPLLKARRFWRTELTEGMSLADFESRFPKGSEGYEHFLNMIAFWETTGSLMQRGLVNEDLAFDTFLDAPPWKKVERIFKEKRARDKQPLEAVNFEWIAGRAAQWIARHEREMQRRR